MIVNYVNLKIDDMDKPQKILLIFIDVSFYLVMGGSKNPSNVMNAIKANPITLLLFTVIWAANGFNDTSYKFFFGYII